MLNSPGRRGSPKKGRSALSGETRSPPSGFQVRRLCHDCSNPWRSDGADGADGTPVILGRAKRGDAEITQGVVVTVAEWRATPEP